MLPPSFLASVLQRIVRVASNRLRRGHGMKHIRRRDGIWDLQLADGLARAVLIDQPVDHHLLLLGGERADAGEDRRRVDHLRRELRRLRLVGVGRFLGLHREGVKNARKQRRT